MKVNWEVGFHQEFAIELMQFSEVVRQEIFSQAGFLSHFGPQLGRPKVDTLNGSKHVNMKELRFNSDGGVWRIAFAFDQKRQAILLVGGDKSGVSQDKFYRRLIEIADRRFDQHQKSISAEGGKS